jgi:hypothetical protein
MAALFFLSRPERRRSHGKIFSSPREEWKTKIAPPRRTRPAPRDAGGLGGGRDRMRQKPERSQRRRATEARNLYVKSELIAHGYTAMGTQEIRAATELD